MKENSSMLPPLLVVRPCEGVFIDSFGEQTRLLLSSNDTKGRFTVSECHAPAGAGPPLQVHSREDFAFFVLSGCYEFHLDGERREVGPGTAVYCPRNVPHTYCVVGDEPGCALTLVWPGGYDECVLRCAREFATGAPDFHRIAHIQSEFGVTLLIPESLEALRTMRREIHPVTSPLVVQSNEGTKVEAQGGQFRHLLTYEQTQGECELVELTAPVGQQAKWPLGVGQSACCWVQSGDYEFEMGKECVKASAGMLVFVPEGRRLFVRATGHEVGRCVLALFPIESENSPF